MRFTAVPFILAIPALAISFDTFDKRWDKPSTACSANTVPKQVRQAYAGDDGMTISWNTNQKLSEPTVFYSKDKSKYLDRSASSRISVTYPTSSTYNNHVTIKGLQPDTTYYYTPDCGSSVLSFKTPRKAGDGAAYSFAYVADLGTMGRDGLSTTVGSGAANPLKPGEKNTISSLSDFKPKYDFVVHNGDIAYADYWLKEEIGGYLNDTVADGPKVYDRILNEFFDEIEPISSAKPYMVSPGNHEANCDNGGTTDKKNNITYTESLCMPGQKNFTGYRNHWKMPSAQSGGVENFWYSWDNGMVHYIIFNTETDFPNAPDLPGGQGKENAGPFAPNGTQLAWLKKDLAAVDRQKTPWIIAAGHRPWYVSNTECTDCRAAFEGLFVQYGVDLLLFGHDHVYERLAPVGLGGVPDPSELNNPAAPWYVINGAAGHYDGLDTLGSPLIKSSRKAVDSVYGWNLFHVHNCTHLTTQFIASQNGSVLDEATLFKKRTCKLNGGNH